MEFLDGEERGEESVFEEIMPGNFSNLSKERNTELQEVKTPSRINPNRHIPRCIIILWKVKNRKNLKSSKDLSHISKCL